MLLDWGLNLADRLVLESCLKSSPEGRHLYEGVGSENVGTIILDMSKYSGDSIHHHIFMTK